MLLKQAAELQESGSVRRILFQKVDPHELPHRIAVVDCILCSFVGQVKPYLQQIRPQHLLDSLGWTTALPAGVKWYNWADPFVPRDDFIHDFQKLFPLRLPLSAAVFNVAECLLLHLRHRPFLGAFILLYPTLYG